MCMNWSLFIVLPTVDGSLLDRFEYSMIMLIQHLVHPSYIYKPNLWHNLLWWCQIKQKKTFCLMAMIFCISTMGISSKRRETLGFWQVKSINTLINIYGTSNLQRLIILWAGKKMFTKDIAMLNLAQMPGTLEMMEYQKTWNQISITYTSRKGGARMACKILKLLYKSHIHEPTLFLIL